MEKLPTADPRKVLAAWIIEKADAEAKDDDRRAKRADIWIERLRGAHELPEMDGFEAWCILNDLPLADEDGLILD